MSLSIDDVSQSIARLPPLHGALAVGVSAFFKYVAPPFPGDLVAAVGAFMVARHAWSFSAVYGAEMIGSMIGFMLVYTLARKVGDVERPPESRIARLRARAEPILDRFRKYGAWYLAANRFIPSVRALLFWAAGFARLPAWQVLIAGTVSAALWSGFLFALGIVAGERWPEVIHALQTYGTTMTVLLVIAVLLLFARWRWRRAR